MNKIKTINAFALAILILLVGHSARSQDRIPHHMQPANEMIGPIAGVPVQVSEMTRAPRYDISQYNVTSSIINVTGNAAWFRLYFDEINLGTASYLTITSLLDGGMQKFDSKSILTWKNSSALFNGTQVEIKLYAAPGEEEIKAHVNQLLVGDLVGGIPETQCGPNDNRVSTTDGAIGRIMPEGCTGWLIPNGNFLTAGHCCSNLAGIDIIEFYVPASTSNGTTVASSPDNQYPVDDASINNQDAGVGDDWCVFSVGTNSTTGKTPVEKNGIIGVLDYSFFRITHDNLPVTGRVTGYGVDQVPPGSGGGRNSSNQTEQTSNGPFVSENTTTANDISLSYTIDTEGGNSGSPVIMDGTRNAIGIHTHGGCNTSATPNTNSGTSFEADDTETGIVNSTAAINKYVDENHPSLSASSGTIFYPYKTMNSAITAAVAGNILNIAEGSYTETIATNKTLILRAPVGLVIIGPNAPAAPTAPIGPAFIASSSSSSLKALSNGNGEDIQISPNPFSSTFELSINSKQEEKAVIVIYNLLGLKVKETVERNLPQGFNKLTFNCADLAQGVYMIEINLGYTKTVKRMVKN